jgi:beta-glucosidase
MDLASFSEEQSAWVADKGEYSIFINASSQQNKLKTTFTLANELVVKKVNNVLAPAQKIEELQ